MLVLIVLAGLTGTGQLALLAFAAGFLIMAGQFGLYALAPQHYGEKVRGVGVGAAVSAGRLGSVFGPLVKTKVGQPRQSTSTAPNSIAALKILDRTC